ncbi:helix-turn-helix transcriptional regulator [Inquilinus sp.]|uniref:response regulator transcription factor n=1 Tax=Inquilinus sp. TaxID=1932117 RepID=UPI0031D219D2
MINRADWTRSGDISRGRWRSNGVWTGRCPAGLTPVLAPQERACLAGVARGGTSKQIARRLGLSMHTVNAYLSSARRKLKASSRSEAVAMALSAGLIDG